MQKLFIATGNEYKYKELEKALSPYFKCQQYDIDLIEIQGTSREIIQYKLLQAFKKTKQAVLVDDVSIHLDSLNGFPGPYVKDFLYTTGIDKIVKLFKNTKVTAICAIGFMTNENKQIIVEGKTKGVVVLAKGNKKFGFDPIFQPIGYDKTFAEMTNLEKHKCSHRGDAIQKLLKKLKS
jgi:inosine triphosphate pyrophosphatase